MGLRRHTYMEVFDQKIFSSADSANTWIRIQIQWIGTVRIRNTAGQFLIRIRISKSLDLNSYSANTDTKHCQLPWIFGGWNKDGRPLKESPPRLWFDDVCLEGIVVVYLFGRELCLVVPVIPHWPCRAQSSALPARRSGTRSGRSREAQGEPVCCIF